MKKIVLIMFAVLGLVACGDKSNQPNLNATALDVGKVELVEVEAKGSGGAPGAAVAAALKMAVEQVNGVSVSSVSENLNSVGKAAANVDVMSSDGHDYAKAAIAAQSQEFAEKIVTSSKGLVASFKVVSLKTPNSGSDQYVAEITAKIAKYQAPADGGKIKIVVMPLRSDKSTFNIGGNDVPADKILGPVRQKIIDSLSQTGRFTVLDREFDSEIQGELGMITSGKTNNIDMAKISQALSADVVWVGKVNALAYEKNVRKLQTADRDLISYSGSWSISQRLINLATRQIMLADSINGDFPKVGPTTLGATINESDTITQVTNSIVKQATNLIIMKTFPVSIVQIDGDAAILSQGEGLLKENTRYKVFALGKEIKDPQTGQSLGNTESECCEILITRVQPKIAYGTLSNVKIKLDGVKPGTLQLRGQIVDAPFQSQAALSTTAATPQPQTPVKPSPKKKDSDW